MIDILDVLPPVNREGSYQGETKGIATTIKMLIQCLSTHVTINFCVRDTGTIQLHPEITIQL